jgi:hypothetical protein
VITLANGEEVRCDSSILTSDSFLDTSLFREVGRPREDTYLLSRERELLLHLSLARERSSGGVGGIVVVREAPSRDMLHACVGITSARHRGAGCTNASDMVRICSCQTFNFDYNIISVTPWLVQRCFL